MGGKGEGWGGGGGRGEEEGKILSHPLSFICCFLPIYPHRSSPFLTVPHRSSFYMYFSNSLSMYCTYIFVWSTFFNFSFLFLYTFPPLFEGIHQLFVFKLIFLTLFSYFLQLFSFPPSLFFVNDFNTFFYFSSFIFFIILFLSFNLSFPTTHPFWFFDVFWKHF